MQGSQKLQSTAQISSQLQLQSIQKARKGNFPRVISTQATSTVLQTLDLEKAQQVDYVIHNKLSYIVKKFSFEYNGLAHANWSRTLNALYQKVKIPIAKIEEYATILTEHAESIQYWKVENALDTFTLMSRIGFFDQLDKLSKNKEEVISLRNKLMSKVSEQLQDIPIKGKNAIRHVCLLKSILDQINQDKNISSISEELLKQTYFSLMNAKEPLLSYHYKEILHTLTEIGDRIDKYVPLFKPLLYKHLSCMAKVEINYDNELNFLAYLLGICNLIAKNLPLEGDDKKNFIQIINKINFTRDKGMAVLGLQSITTMINKEKIPLKPVETKINECIDFIKDKDLELFQSSIVLISISKHISSLHALNMLASLPDDLKAVIDKHFATLVENKDLLSADMLQTLFKTLRNLICVNYPVAIILDQFCDVIDKSKVIFLNASPREIHGIIANLTKVLVHERKEFDDQLTPKLTNFLNTLMPKYLSTIINAPLSEMVNSFITLSSLIDSGYLANQEMKTAFNVLLSKIDKEVHLLTQKQLINFFRAICLNYTLFTLNDKKIIEYATKLVDFSASKTKINELSVKSKSIILWSMLVFYETNYEKFSKKLVNKFKDAIISLYKALDKEKKNHELTSSQSIGHILAANWLGYQVNECCEECLLAFDNNDVQKNCLRVLQTKFGQLHFEEEQSINGLPPCDIVVHDKKIAIEVQGMYHFLDKERRLTNGTTILKNALLRKNNYHVIEVKVEDGKVSDAEFKACFNKIEEVLNKTPSC